MKKNQYSLKEAMDEMFKESGMKKKILSLRSKDLWIDTMGDFIGKYTKEVFLKDHAIYVCLTSAELREELSFSKTKIIASLNENLKEVLISEIYFI